MANDPYYGGNYNYARDIFNMNKQQQALGQQGLSPQSIDAILGANARAEQDRMVQQENIKIQNDRTKIMQDEEKRRQEEAKWANYMGIGSAIGNVALLGPMAYKGWQSVFSGSPNTTMLPPAQAGQAQPALSALEATGGYPAIPEMAGAGETGGAAWATPEMVAPGYTSAGVGEAGGAATGGQATATGASAGWGGAAIPIGVGAAAGYGAYKFGNALGGPKMGWSFVNPFVGPLSYTKADKYLPSSIHKPVDKAIDTVKSWF